MRSWLRCWLAVLIALLPKPVPGPIEFPVFPSYELLSFHDVLLYVLLGRLVWLVLPVVFSSLQVHKLLRSQSWPRLWRPRGGLIPKLQLVERYFLFPPRIQFQSQSLELHL